MQSKKLVLLFSLLIISTLLALCGCGKGNQDKPENNNDVKINYSISKTEIEVVIGEEFQLEILADKEFDEKVVWESDNTLIATVDSNGFVFGNAIGKTRIVSRINGETFYTYVTVVENNDYYPSIILDGETKSIIIDGETKPSDYYTFTIFMGETYTLNPKLVLDKVVDGVEFDISSSSDLIDIDKYSITGKAVGENIDVVISCNYNNETYSITAKINIDNEEN